MAVGVNQVIPAGNLGSLSYRGNADYFGSDSFMWSGSDGLGYSAGASVSVLFTTSASFTAGPDQQVEENSGPQTVTGWATAISAGSPAPADPSLTFEVTGDTNPSLFSAAPAVDAATGDLTFTPAQDVFGTATLSLVLADGADDQDSATQQFTLTVEPPPIVTGFSKAVLENGTVSFTAGDFTGHFESNDLQDTPATVEITSLPALGQLTLSGTAVSLDQTIPAAQVGNLVYHAARGVGGRVGLVHLVGERRTGLRGVAGQRLDQHRRRLPAAGSARLYEDDDGGRHDDLRFQRFRRTTATRIRQMPCRR